MENKKTKGYMGGLAAMIAVFYLSAKIIGFLEDTHQLGINLYVYVIVMVALSMFAFIKVQKFILEKE